MNSIQTRLLHQPEVVMAPDHSFLKELREQVWIPKVELKLQTNVDS